MKGWATTGLQLAGELRQPAREVAPRRRPGSQAPEDTRSVHVCGAFTAYVTNQGSEKGIRLAQKVQVSPCIPMGIQL
jgi:hypothetical protein